MSLVDRVQHDGALGRYHGLNSSGMDRRRRHGKARYDDSFDVVGIATHRPLHRVEAELQDVAHLFDGSDAVDIYFRDGYRLDKGQAHCDSPPRTRGQSDAGKLFRARTDYPVGTSSKPHGYQTLNPSRHLPATDKTGAVHSPLRCAVPVDIAGRA